MAGNALFAPGRGGADFFTSVARAWRKSLQAQRPAMTRCCGVLKNASEGKPAALLRGLKNKSEGKPAALLRGLKK